MSYRYQAATHGVQPVFDPALYDGGGLGPHEQGNGTGRAPHRRNSSQSYKLNDGDLQPPSPGFPSACLIDSDFIYPSPPYDTQAPTTNTLQNHLLFDPDSGLHFLPNDTSFSIPTPYAPLYHHNPFPMEAPLSMELYHGVDLTRLTTGLGDHSAAQGHCWESAPFPNSVYGGSNHLDDLSLAGGSQGAVTSVHPGSHYTLGSLVSVPSHDGSGTASFPISPIPTYRSGQTHQLPTHTSTDFNTELNHPYPVALSRYQRVALDSEETENTILSRLNTYTLSNLIGASQGSRSIEHPLRNSGSTNQNSHSKLIDDSSYQTPPRNGSRVNSPIPTISDRKWRLSSRAQSSNPKPRATSSNSKPRATSSNPKSRRTGNQCHVRPLRSDQMAQVPSDLRPWFHNQVRCDPIPPELYRGMFTTVEDKEFCAIHGCTFETTASRRRRGLKYDHANRHLNHKQFYCLTCTRGYGRKEDHGLHPLIIASSLPVNPYLSIPGHPITHNTDSETSHTPLA